MFIVYLSWKANDKQSYLYQKHVKLETYFGLYIRATVLKNKEYSVLIVMQKNVTQEQIDKVMSK